MQTKVILIFAICSFQVIAACTRPKSSNEQISSESTSVASLPTVDTSQIEKVNEVEAVKAASDQAQKAVVAQGTSNSVPQTKPAQATQPKNEQSKVKINKEPTPPSAEKHPIAKLDTSLHVQSETFSAPLAAPSHEIWDQLLRKYVSRTGKVNYKGLKAEKQRLEAYLKLLGGNPAQTSWSRNERLAYWINVYNAFTVKLIIDQYPLKSITDLEKPWDKVFITIGDKKYSLNQVENEIIRPRFQEPRIHFAVNCAAKSCPPLLNEAFVASKLNAQLEKQTRAFLNNEGADVISAGELKLSKIFEWYEEDFKNLIPFVEKYTDKLISADAAISFKPYDWSLNE